jgi:hypothetical protein
MASKKSGPQSDFSCNQCGGGCIASSQGLLSNDRHESPQMRYSKPYVTPDSEDDSDLGLEEIETKGFIDDKEEGSCFDDKEISEVMEEEISEKS